MFEFISRKNGEDRNKGPEEVATEDDGRDTRLETPDPSVTPDARVSVHVTGLLPLVLLFVPKHFTRPA
jgi:hypothetical protein